MRVPGGMDHGAWRIHFMRRCKPGGSAIALVPRTTMPAHFRAIWLGKSGCCTELCGAAPIFTATARLSDRGCVYAGHGRDTRYAPQAAPFAATGRRAGAAVVA